MNSINLSNLIIEDNRIQYIYEIKGEWEKFFKNRREYTITYDYELTNVPKSIAAIPFVLNVLPMVWLFNATFIVNSLDQELYNSIVDIKQAYVNMYPQITFGGEIIVANIIKTQYEGKKIGLFYSGGLDAASTLTEHYNEEPLLINIQGSDLSLSYVKVLEDGREFLTNISQELNLNITFVKSGFRRVIKEKRVTKYFFEKINDDYWHAFQHGIAIIGHAAPIAYIKKLKCIYIAASFTKESLRPCASDPTIDNKVKLGSTAISHDGFEYDRNKKSDKVIQFINNKNKNITLRVCYEDYRVDNCCRCEKCYRTIMNFCAKGFDINRIGFNLKYEDFRVMRFDIENRIILSSIVKDFWITIIKEFYKHPELKDDERYRWIYFLDIDNINNNKKKKVYTFIHKYIRRIKKVLVLVKNIIYGLKNRHSI